MRKINTIAAALLIMLALCGCKSGQIAREEYVFYAYGIEIEVGDDVDEVIARLGAPNRCAAAESCAGLGCDEVYIYNGFKISAYREEGECEIVEIELTNDTVKTAEGISIGSPESALRAAYGEGRDFAGGREYKGEDAILRFYLSDGRVSGIKYLKTGD